MRLPSGEYATAWLTPPPSLVCTSDQWVVNNMRRLGMESSRTISAWLTPPPSLLFASLSHPHTPTLLSHTQTHTHTLLPTSLSLSHTHLYFSLSHTHSLSHTLSHSHTPQSLLSRENASCEPGAWCLGAGQEGRCKVTWKREFKLPWREAGPPNHHDDRLGPVGCQYRTLSLWVYSVGCQFSGVSCFRYRVSGTHFQVSSFGFREYGFGFRDKSHGLRMEG